MEPLNQLQKEWVVINAVRELLGIITDMPGAKYAEAIKFAKDIYPSLFQDSKTGIDRKDSIEKLHEKYRQEAIAVSREKKNDVTPRSLIENRLKQIQSYLKQFKKGDEDPNRLRREAKDLKLILGMNFEVNTLQKITESQSINNDSFNKRYDKVFVNNHLGKFVEYINNEENELFRITVLHPNPSEAIIGADLIYEQYDELKKMVRIVAIQYKIWDGTTLYFSKADNLEAQIKKMNSIFCGKDFCKNCKGGSNLSKDKYRLSYCMAFLKPTDKLQDPKKLTTTGYHLPICKVNKLKEKTRSNYKLTKGAIKNQSLKTVTFEELFNSEMIGSRWMKIKDLETFYQKNKVLEPNEKIILYAQGAVLADYDKL